MGENRLLVAGGILDQPAGLFMAARHAGYVAYLMDEYTRDPDSIHAEWRSPDDRKRMLDLQRMESEERLKNARR